MTEFVSKALETAIRRVDAAPETVITRRFRGVPTFFRAACMTASQGGEHSYAHAGYTLGGHVRSLLDQEHEDREVEMKLRVLRALLNAEKDAEVLAWFDRELPGCMALVPREKRKLLVRGIYRRHDEKGDVADVRGR